MIHIPPGGAATLPLNQAAAARRPGNPASRAAWARAVVLPGVLLAGLVLLSYLHTREAAPGADWLGFLPWHLAMGGPPVLALFGLSLGTMRRRLAAEEAQAALERGVAERTAAIAENEARLRRVQRIGRVGGFEIDLRSGLNARSAEYMALQGVAPAPAWEHHQDWVRRLHPEDRERAERRFLQAVADGAPDTEYAQDYRILTPDGEIRWISARAEIERDGQGRALRMVGAHLDITETKLAEARLAASEQSLRLAQEAAQVGTWEWDPDTGRGAWSRHQFALFGLDPSAGTPPGYEAFLRLVHPEDRDAVREAAHEARRTGLYQVEFRIRRGAEGETRWLIGRGRRMPGPDGCPGRILGVNVDITERKLAEERHHFLAREVDHRAKNALAVVQAAMRLTRGGTVAEYRQTVEGRIAALARAHSLLSDQGWRGAELRSLIEGELAPFIGGAPDAPRADLDGPPVTMPAGAVQPVSMVLHELATNAVKHGALGVPGGVVAISWRVEPAERVLHLRWAERGGPPVERPPERRGFGSRVLQGAVGDQLRGQVVRHWEPEGLVVEITAPLQQTG